MYHFNTDQGPISLVNQCGTQHRSVHTNKCLLVTIFIMVMLMYHNISRGTYSRNPVPLIRVNNLSCAEAFQVYCKFVDQNNSDQEMIEAENRELRNDLISQSVYESKFTQSAKEATSNTSTSQTAPSLSSPNSGLGIKEYLISPDYTKWCRQRLLGCKCPPGQSFDRSIGDCVILSAPLGPCTRNQECQLYDPLTFCDYAPLVRHESPFCNCVPSAELNSTINRCICKQKGENAAFSILGNTEEPCHTYRSQSTSLAYSAKANQLLLPIKVMMVIVTSILILVVIFCLGSTFYQKIKESMHPEPSNGTLSPNRRLSTRSQSVLASPDAFSSGSRSSPDFQGFEAQITSSDSHFLFIGNPGDCYDTRGRPVRITRGQHVQTDSVPSEHYLYRYHQEEPPPTYDEAMKHTKVSGTVSCVTTCGNTTEPNSSQVSLGRSHPSETVVSNQSDPNLNLSMVT